MFSPSLTKKDVPDAIWLPAEIRLQLDQGESPSASRSAEGVNLREVLQQKLNVLSDKIGHIESVLARLNIEGRLRSLEGGRQPVRKHS